MRISHWGSSPVAQAWGATVVTPEHEPRHGPSVENDERRSLFFCSLVSGWGIAKTRGLTGERNGPVHVDRLSVIPATEKPNYMPTID